MTFNALPQCNERRSRIPLMQRFSAMEDLVTATVEYRGKAELRLIVSKNLSAE